MHLVGQGAAHVSVGASGQVGRTHGPDRTQECDHQGRDAHHRSIRAHRGHCARAVAITALTSTESYPSGPFPTRDGPGKERPRRVSAIGLLVVTCYGRRRG